MSRMPSKAKSSLKTAAFAAILAGLVLLPASAQAYVGPGAGLGMIGSLIAVVAAVLVAVFGLLLFPLRLLLKRRKAKAQSPEADTRAGEQPPAE